MPPVSPETSLSRFSVLDWIGVLVVGTSGLFALVVPVLLAPTFLQLSEALGVTTPSLGARVLRGWMPVALGLVPLAVLGYALGVRQPVMRRRMLVLLAFALTVLASVVLLVALYGTLFAAAGSAAGP